MVVNAYLHCHVTKLAQKILYVSTNAYLHLKQINSIDKMLPHAHASTQYV